MNKIGILGFQGAIIEHERQIKAIGHEPVIVKYPEQLEEIDGIILPGGESTTMGKILNRTGLDGAFSTRENPEWAAGMGNLMRE